MFDIRSIHCEYDIMSISWDAVCLVDLILFMVMIDRRKR